MGYKEKRIPTVAFERALLKRLFKDRMALQTRLSSCNRDWFTSGERLALFSYVQLDFEESHSLLTRAQLEYRLDSGGVPSGKKTCILAEYDLICGSPSEDDVNAVISKLNDALLGTDFEQMLVDAYELLDKGRTEEAIRELKQKVLSIRCGKDEGASVSLWDDTDDWEAEIINRRDCPEKYAGIPTGFGKFDGITGGLFPAELNVVFGLSGKGKSTLMKQIAVNVRRAGFNVLHCANEENMFQIRSKYTSVETGVKYSHWKRGSFTDEELKLYREYRNGQNAEGKGRIYIYTFPQQTDATMISRKLMEYRDMGVRIDLVIVDYLDLMSPVKRAYNENDEGGKITGDLKQLANDFNIPVLVATQANTTAEKQEMRERPFLTAADVFGTKRKVHSANMLIGIVNQSATVGAGDRDESELKRHRLVICVPKNRDGPPFTFRLSLEAETGRISSDEDADDPMGAKLESDAKRLMEDAAKLESDEEKTRKEREKAKELRGRLEGIIKNMDESVPNAEEDSRMESSYEGLLPEDGFGDNEFLTDAEGMEKDAESESRHVVQESESDEEGEFVKLEKAAMADDADKNAAGTGLEVDYSDMSSKVMEMLRERRKTRKGGFFQK